MDRPDTSAAAGGPDLDAPTPTEQPPPPDLSQVLPDAVLRSVISVLDLFDSVALASTCKRLLHLVDERDAELEGGGSITSGSSSGSRSSGPPAAGSQRGGAASARRVARRSALARAVTSGSWRWALLPALEQQGGNSSSSRRSSSSAAAPINYAAYLSLPQSVVSNATSIITDTHATAFLGPAPASKQQQQQQQQRIAQTDTLPGASPQQHPPVAPAPLPPQPPPSDNHLIQGHLPTKMARRIFVGPAWDTPGRRWPMLQRIVAMQPPCVHAAACARSAADALAAWPPRLVAACMHAKWLDPDAPHGALVVPVGEGEGVREAARGMLVS